MSPRLCRLQSTPGVVCRSACQAHSSVRRAHGALHARHRDWRRVGASLYRFLVSVPVSNYPSADAFIILVRQILYVLPYVSCRTQLTYIIPTHTTIVSAIPVPVQDFGLRPGRVQLYGNYMKRGVGAWEDNGMGVRPSGRSTKAGGGWVPELIL